MKQTKRTLVSLLLVFAMLATCLVAFSVTSSAALATELPTSWGAELPEGVDAWGSGKMTTASTSLSGSGTKADPYLIANVADFMYFVNTAAAAATADTYFKMTGDVYFPVISSTTSTISSDASVARDFTPPTFAGILDGGGHTIWNPRNGLNKASSCSTIFDTLNGATVKNLTVKGAFLVNTSTGGWNSESAAGLASYMNGGTVENCHVTETYLAGVEIGGLIKKVSGDATIKNCTVDGTFAPTVPRVTKYDAFGGIVSRVENGGNVVIQNCENRMACPEDSNYLDVGGILGIAYSGTSITMSNCKNYSSYKTTSTSTNTSKGIGGIVGRVYNSVTMSLTECQNFGTFIAPNNCGGLFGYFNASNAGNNATMTKCVNYGDITAAGQNAGGLIGGVFYWVGGTFLAQDTSNYGNIKATNCAGGFVGNVSMNISTIKSNTIKPINFANYGNVTATNKFAGLLVGFYSRGSSGTIYIPNISVTNSVLLGTVTAGACAGSVCGGYATTVADQELFISITKSYVYCTIDAAERSGSICGGWLSTDTEVTGSYSNATGLSLTTTGSKFNVTLNGATSNIGYYVADAGQTVSLTALDTAELTNGTALAALNTYATDNTLTAWVQGTKAPELESFYQAPTAVQVTLDGATLSLDDTMTLKLFVKASSVSEIADLATIMVNDGTKDYAGTLDATAENYVFEIAGLAAGDMGTAKTYTVKYTLASDTANPIVCDTGVEYSPLQYAINMYNKNKADTTPNANFAALLTSMVRYMDAAGATNAMSTFSSATSYEFGDTTAAYTAIIEKATEYNIPADTMSLAAELTSGITLLVKPADGKTLTSVKIGTDALTIESAGTNTWRVNGLNPGDLYNELTFTFTTEEGTTEVTYSVARYLNSYVGTEYETLAKATALYMDAFITYKTLG